MSDMKNDKKDILNQISAWNDAQLKAAVSQIAASLGASEEQIRIITGDMGRVKGVIGSITDSDLNKLEQNLGDEQRKKIQSIVNKQRKG